MPVESSDHAALMRQAQTGDAQAFAGLVHAFTGRLFRFLTATGLPAADADDLVQETFIRVHRHLGRYDARWSVSTWLHTIAHRLALNHHRDRRPQQALEGHEQATAETDDHADDAGADDRIWEVARAVLSPRDFQLLWLRYGEDRTMDELAVILGVQPGAAKVALHRARQRLARHLPGADGPLAVAETSSPLLTDRE